MAAGVCSYTAKKVCFAGLISVGNAFPQSLHDSVPKYQDFVREKKYPRQSGTKYMYELVQRSGLYS